MDAPPGPLRSPDGLWWWDGGAWQPITSLGAPPGASTAAPPPKEEGPPGGAWQPPVETAQPAAAAWQPPRLAAEAPADASPPTPSPAQATEEVQSFGAWQPPGAVVPEPPPDTRPQAWQPPPGVADAPQSPPPPGGLYSPPATPPPAPPPPVAPGSPPEQPWPGWLPHTELAEAMVQDVPTHVRGATAAPASAPAAPNAPPPGFSEAPASSWVAQLYPARAALNANRQLVTYAALGVLGLIALFVLYQVLAQMNLFGAGAGSAPPDTGPTGSQFRQADRFLGGSLNPALDSVTFNATQIPTDCGGTHSVTCQSTLESADTAFLKAIAIIDKGPFPSCLAAAIVQARHDLVNLDQAIKAALIGFKGNDGLVTKGLADFAGLASTLKTNGDALRAAEQSACPKGT